MNSLIKKDLILVRPWEYLIFLSVIAFLHLIKIAPDLTFAITFVVLIIMLFFYDHYYKMNRYVRSLPVNLNKVVMSRYISSYTIVIAILCFQYILINIIKLFRPSDYLYSLNDGFILICLATIFIAIVIPVYHLFKSYYTASFIVFVFIMIAASTITTLSFEITIVESSDPEVLWTASSENLSLLDTIKLYVTTEFLTIIGILTLALLIVSYLFSVYISRRKDLT